MTRLMSDHLSSSLVLWSWRAQEPWLSLLLERTLTMESLKWKFNKMKIKLHFNKNWLSWPIKSERSVWCQPLLHSLLCSCITFTIVSWKNLSLKHSSQLKPSTKSLNSSLLPFQSLSSPSQKDFLSQLLLPWPIQLARWNKKTIWSDIFKPVKPWVVLITYALIKPVPSQRISWQSPRYSSRLTFMNQWIKKSWAIIPADCFH